MRNLLLLSQRNVTPDFCPYLRQTVTDLLNSFTGVLRAKICNDAVRCQISASDVNKIFFSEFRCVLLMGHASYRNRVLRGKCNVKRMTEPNTGSCTHKSFWDVLHTNEQTQRHNLLKLRSHGHEYEYESESGVTGSAYRRAEFTRERYCACATYLLVELVNMAHLRWAQITKRADFTKA